MLFMQYYAVFTLSESSKFDKLKAEALDWQLAMTIRDYIRAVETRVLTMRIPVSEKTE